MDDDTHLDYIYINADMRLDPEGELLLTDHYMEMHLTAVRQSKCLAERQEPQALEAKVLNNDKDAPSLSQYTPSEDNVTTVASSKDGTLL